MTTNKQPSEQIHAGKASHIKGKSLWHTDPEGRYWCGYTNHRTPKELLDECTSTVTDLIRNHPELASTQPAPSADLEIPRILFDGYAVLEAMPDSFRKRTSSENVGDVLDTVVAILRKEIKSAGVSV